MELKILVWNCNSLRSKTTELQHFLKNHQIDIALLNETHLTPAVKANVANYTQYRNDRRAGKGGGTAILIKNSISNEPRHTQKETKIETTGAIIHTANGNIQLNAIYCPPGKDIPEEDLNQIFNNNTPTIAAGDYNARSERWGTKWPNRAGKLVEKYTEENNVGILVPDTPTRYTGNSRDRGEVLDFALIKNINQVINIDVLDELSSDHLSVIITLACNINKNIQTHKQTDWDKFRTQLNKSLKVPIINNADEIEHACEHISTNIQKAIEKSTKIQEIKELKNGLPQYIIELIKKKNNMKKTYRTTLDATDKTKINKLNEEIKEAIRNRGRAPRVRLKQNVI